MCTMFLHAGTLINKNLIIFFIYFGMVLSCLIYTAVLSLPPAERQNAITQAVSEAKLEAKLRDEANNKASTQAAKERKYTSGQLLSKFFKRASEKAKKIGKAQLLYEQMVRKTERKLAELKRKSHASVQSAEARAEGLAEELFHKPGSLLTKEEIAHLWQESGCVEVREPPVCNFPTVNQFRTIDGSCNNLENPLFGASGIAFTRIIAPVYEDGISSLRGRLQALSKSVLDIGPFVPPNPSARLISSAVVQNRTQDEIPFTHILMQWGQFLDHDMDIGPEFEAECEGCEITELCEPIRVPDLDTAFGVGTPQNGDCLRFARSVPACDISRPGEFLPREQINDLTSYIDGSMVYGSNEEIGNAVRLFENGLLRTGPNFPGNQPSLPVDNQFLVACPNAQDCFLCGDVRCNEQISLSIMHTIWLREHNRIARELGRLNPLWDDERIFQEARLIVGALIQKITYVDYLPKVLGPEVFNRVIGPYPGYNPEVNAGTANAFATAAYRYGHSLIRPQFDRLGPDFLPLAIGPLNLRDAFFNPGQFRTSLGTDPILRGLINVNARRVDEFLNRVLTTQLFETSTSPGMDLASLNIQRGRDHGLPPYPTWKNFCLRTFGLVSDFENDLTLVRFLQNYGSLETLDLWVGGLAENRLPNSLLGATFACIFGITFSNTRAGDRFFYENPGVFTPAQRRQIRRGSLSRVLCDNSDNIDMIQPDAFLSNQTRVNCNQIPRVNLQRWREEVCFFRARVQPRNFDLDIRTFSRSIQANFVFSSASVLASQLNQFMCVPIQCPTATVATDVIVYSSRELLNTLKIENNAALPASSLSLSGVYRAFWTQSQIQSGVGGVFSSFADCQVGAEPALTFSLPSVQSAEVEAKLLAKATQTGGSSDNPESPQTSETVPDPILEILKKPNPKAVVEEADMESETAAEQEKASVASDEKLLNDLEDALKKLGNH